MRLYPDCIRAVLLAAENCSMDETLRFPELCDRLSSEFLAEDIQYTCLKLEEANMLKIVTTNKNTHRGFPMVIKITDITYEGHQFLAKIHDEQQWRAVKKGLSAVRDYSLSAISSVAEGVTSATISAYFSGNTNP